MIKNKYDICKGCYCYRQKDKEEWNCDFLFVMPSSCPCLNCLVKGICSKECTEFTEFYRQEKDYKES
jgi:hypothetical protein